jgi:predicted dinucleotide-binding enzyme
MTTIGVLGTGNLATALGTRWACAGHDVVIAGRSRERAAATAAAAGGRAVPPADLAIADVIVLAITPAGVEEALALAGAGSGAWRGRTLVDCTNAIDYSTGDLLVSSGSFAQRVAAWAPGAHVVKALHLFAGQMWLDDPERARTVAICGDDAHALAATERLIADLGGETAMIGGLSVARQLEEVAGFVMRLVGAGHNPRLAVPDVPPARGR